jgi:hypothetical protein
LIIVISNRRKSTFAHFLRIWTKRSNSYRFDNRAIIKFIQLFQVRIKWIVFNHNQSSWRNNGIKGKRSRLYSHSYNFSIIRIRSYLKTPLLNYKLSRCS